MEKIPEALIQSLKYEMIENTVKKKQHYLPKFYLRNFSYCGNNKQIGIFHLENKRYCPTSTLKDQGSKNFFYGADGKMEDHLSILEGLFSQSIRKIVDNIEIPKDKNDDHYNLLMFILLTDLRNPVRISNAQDMVEKGKSLLQAQSPEQNMDKFMPSVDHETAINLTISQLTVLVPYINDLGYKLLVNKTNVSFVSSDFPIVKYNQILERLKWKHAKAGYGTIGLQIFVPLSPELSVIFYDQNIYKVGNKKEREIYITDENDIYQLNLLQFVNCFETVYFNENVSKEYVFNMHTKSKKYQKPNVIKAEMHYVVAKDEKFVIAQRGESKKNLLITGNTDCETNLNLSFVKLQSGATNIEIGNKAALIRKWPLKVMELTRLGG